MHGVTLLCGLTIALVAACDRGEAAGARPVTASVPVETQGGTRFQYPVYRIPPKIRPTDPVRNPAVKPKLLSSVAPQYTEEARKSGIQGVVILEIIVETDGRVSGGRVLKPLPHGLSASAIDAVRQWRYAPARNDRGQPVRALVTIDLPFRPGP